MSLKEAFRMALREGLDIDSAMEGYVMTKPEVIGTNWPELELFVKRLNRYYGLYPTKVRGRMSSVRFIPPDTVQLISGIATEERKVYEEKVPLRGIRTLDKGASFFIESHLYGGTREVYFSMPFGESSEKLMSQVPIYSEAHSWKTYPRQKLREVWACAIVGNTLVCGKVPAHPQPTTLPTPGAT